MVDTSSSRRREGTRSKFRAGALICALSATSCATLPSVGDAKAKAFFEGRGGLAVAGSAVSRSAARACTS
jgi:hypothetical protein